jgi:hypothetical protein
MCSTLHEEKYDSEHDRHCFFIFIQAQEKERKMLKRFYVLKCVEHY